MKKRMFLDLLVILLVFNFIGCDNDSDENKEFTVTFELEGGNINGNTSPLQITVKSVEVITNIPEPIKINGYLNGWFAEKNGVGNEFTLSTKVLSNQIVYANWINPFIGEWKEYIYVNENIIDNNVKHEFYENMTWILYSSNDQFKGIYSFIASEITLTLTHMWQSDEWKDFLQEYIWIIYDIDDNKIKLYENGIDTLLIWENI